MLVLLKTGHRLLANGTDYLGTLGIEPNFKLVDRMLTLGFIHNTKTYHVSIINQALHDAMRQTLPVSIQKIWWQVMLGKEFALALGILPFRLDALLEERVFGMLGDYPMLTIVHSCLEEKRLTWEWQMVKIHRSGFLSWVSKEM